jgi:hypothetical protein
MRHKLTNRDIYKTILLREVTLLVLLFFIGNSNSTIAQYHLSLGVNYAHSFGERSLDLLGTSYQLNPTNGGEVLLRNEYQFKRPKKLHARLNIGYRFIYFSGQSNTSSYKGSLQKAFASGGIGYELTERITTSAYIEVENNVAFKKFEIGKGDLFRVSLATEVMFQLTDKFAILGLFSRAMTPITPAYIFSNPQYQIRIGLNYQIL